MCQKVRNTNGIRKERKEERKKKEKRREEKRRKEKKKEHLEGVHKPNLATGASKGTLAVVGDNILNTKMHESIMMIKKQ